MAEDLQDLVDTHEEVVAARYRRQQELAVLIGEAQRRADALQRLELTLHYGNVGANRHDPSL